MVVLACHFALDVIFSMSGLDFGPFYSRTWQLLLCSSSMVLCDENSTASVMRREGDWDVCGTCRWLKGDAKKEGKGRRQG